MDTYSPHSPLELIHNDISVQSRPSVPFTYALDRPTPLQRLSGLNLIKHVPRAVFKSNTAGPKLNGDSITRSGQSRALDVPAPAFLSSTSGHHRSHSDSLPNSERPVFKLIVQPPHESMNESPPSQLVLGQAREQGSSANSQGSPSIFSHISSGPSSTNISGLDSTEDALEEVIVPELLLHGTPLLKVSAKKVQNRVFRLDPDRGQISWESKKTKYCTYPLFSVHHAVLNVFFDQVSIDAIKEIRTGEDTRSYRVQLKIAADAESRWITIIYLTDLKYKTLNLVAPSIDVYHMWIDTVRKLWNLRQELANMSEGKTNGDAARDVLRKEKVWERLYWKTANEAGGGRLEWREVKKLCLRLNIHAPEVDLLRKFKVVHIYLFGVGRVLIQRGRKPMLIIKVSSTSLTSSVSFDC